MKPRYFDAHSHLNFAQFDEDREALIGRMEQEGVWTICVGTGLQTSQESVALAEKYDHVFATVGVHPSDWEEGFNEEEYSQLADHPKVVAVGECGLDYYRLTTEDQRQKPGQRELFEQQIEFAKQHNLPLMIHGRPSKGTMDAYQDILDILATYNSPLTTKNPGNVHFFVGNTDIARQFLELGFTLSFDGPITFTHEYDEVVQYAPLDMMLAETDAPFAAPEPHRGKRNEPLYVQEIARRIAQIRDEEEERVRIQLVANVLRVFNIPH